MSNVKLGTVGSHNRALRALTEGGSAFVDEYFLADFASERPEDYLHCIEMASDMVRKGPAFALKGRRLHLGSIVFERIQGEIRKTVALAEFEKTHEGWMLRSLEVSPADDDLPWIKFTPESMASKEDWESVCEMADVCPEDAASVTLCVAKTDFEFVDDEDEDTAPSAPTSRHTGLTVKATVTFQRWEGDYARFNGEAEFDACDALDEMDDEMIRRVAQGEPYALDAVYKGAVRLGQIHDYDGPFEVDLDEDNLSDYLAARGVE